MVKSVSINQNYVKWSPDIKNLSEKNLYEKTNQLMKSGGVPLQNISDDKEEQVLLCGIEIIGSYVGS